MNKVTITTTAEQAQLNSGTSVHSPHSVGSMNSIKNLNATLQAKTPVRFNRHIGEQNEALLMVSTIKRQIEALPGMSAYNDINSNCYFMPPTTCAV
jgi:hypothetical protein